MGSSELLTTTFKWNKIHDPRTGQFSAVSKGGQHITSRKRVPGGGRGISAGRKSVIEEDVQAKANIAKAAVMPLSQFMQSSFVGPKNQRLDAMISEMPVGTTISGWTKIQGKNGTYWKKGGATALTLGSGVAGSSVHKAIISSAVRNGSLSAKNAVKIHSSSYNNIASWASLRKLLATNEIQAPITYKAVAFIRSTKFTPKKKLQNKGSGFAGTKKIPVPESGRATNYSLTGEPVPPPKMYVLSEIQLLKKLSDEERSRVQNMTGNTVVAGGAKWKKDAKNGSTIFQRVMQVFDNMKDYSKPEKPFFSKIKKYTHRNPVTKKEREDMGGIHINPDNAGKFTATKKRTGKTTEELTHSKNPLTKKRAVFAENAAKWTKTSSGKKERTRDYRAEYDNYHKRPEQRSRRVLRNQARRKMGLRVGDPREVDHKQPLSKNGGNSPYNLRAISFSENRKKGNKTVKELVSLSFKNNGVDTSIDNYDVLEYLEAQN